jgi:hypothetical protein
LPSSKSYVGPMALSVLTVGPRRSPGGRAEGAWFAQSAVIRGPLRLEQSSIRRERITSWWIIRKYHQSSRQSRLRRTRLEGGPPGDVSESLRTLRPPPHPGTVHPFPGSEPVSLWRSSRFPRGPDAILDGNSMEGFPYLRIVVLTLREVFPSPHTSRVSLAPGVHASGA